MDRIYRILLCRIGLHRKKPFHDIEWSQRGEHWYCYFCDEYFDKNKKRIRS